MAESVLSALWIVWISQMSGVLDARVACHLPRTLVGVLFARGRRTAASWWRAANIGDKYDRYHYFLSCLGRKSNLLA